MVLNLYVWILMGELLATFGSVADNIIVPDYAIFVNNIWYKKWYMEKCD